MTKRGEFGRAIVFIVGGTFAIQLPIFITLLKLVKLPGPSLGTSEDGFSGSSWHTTGPMEIHIERSLVSNSCHSNEASSPASSRSPFQPLSVAHYAYVVFSAYRRNLNSFFVLGITSVMVRQYENNHLVYNCEWVANNESGGAPSSSQEDLVTKAQMLYVPFDENGETYVSAIVNCTFNQSVGADGEGGVLRLHVVKGPSFWGDPYMVEDVFTEEPGDGVEKMRRLLQEDEEKGMEELLPYKYAFCGPPIYGVAQNRDWILNWLAYHHYLWEGKGHFYFYVVDDGLDTATLEILEPWIKGGLVTLIDAAGGEQYPSWYRNQVLFINDCLHRTAFTARWTFFHDMDELVYVPAPNTLASLLEENRDKPWMSFGNLPVAIDYCKMESSSASEELWYLERFLWHQQRPECMHEDEDHWTCVGSPGRRKLVVNPRKLFVLGIHQVPEPEEGAVPGGLHFNASVARINHFHGISDPRANVCNIPVNMSTESGPLNYDIDYATASLMPEIRRFAGSLLPPSLNAHNIRAD